MTFSVLLRQNPLDFVPLDAHVPVCKYSLNLIHFRVILVINRVYGADAAVVTDFGKVFREKGLILFVSIHLFRFGDCFFHLAD